MSAVIEPEVMQKLSSLLVQSQGRAVVLSDGDGALGALVSMEDYEIVRKAKVERFLKASAELGEQIRSRAAEEGLTPEDLLKRVDQKAS